MLIDARHSYATSAELNNHLEILEYLARAAPRVVAAFLALELDSLVQLAESSGDPKVLGRIRAVVAELVDDSDTGSMGFEMLMRLAIREARRGGQKGAADVVRECFVLLVLCQSGECEIASVAREKLPQAFGTLSQDLPADHAMKILREAAALHFGGRLPMDTRELCGQLRWIRDRYSQHREGAGQGQWRDDWGRVIAEIDGWIGSTLSPHPARAALATAGMQTKSLSELRAPILMPAWNCCATRSRDSPTRSHGPVRKGGIRFIRSSLGISGSL